MKIVIIHCHTANRGDEAAVHALVDELNILYPECKITLFMRGNTRYPNMPDNVVSKYQYSPIGKKKTFEYWMIKVSKGKLAFTEDAKTFLEEIKNSDIILHAPGGPSIGDTYFDGEPQYLRIYDILKVLKKRYMFYAPSMGPFEREERNAWRKRVLLAAEAIVIRDPISAVNVKKLITDKPIFQTLDSALQHDIDLDLNKKKLDDYSDLKRFIDNNEKIVGITITDLLWHPIFSKDKKTEENINKTFTRFLNEIVRRGYRVIFIPQLYGAGNDFDLMNSFALDNQNYFIIPDNDDRYDTYFQQYLIGQLYAVIGMRYHSNIFSAKMNTPFVSISYEQKMKGFMEKMNLSQYCLDIQDLDYDQLIDKFQKLELDHNQYKNYLISKHEEVKKESYKTTEILKEILSMK